MQRKFTDDDLIVLYNQGLSDGQIASKLGVSKTSVSTCRSKLGLWAHFNPFGGSKSDPNERYKHIQETHSKYNAERNYRQEYIRNRERILGWAREYRKTDRRRCWEEDYRQTKIKYHGRYMGTIDCPKCGKRGQLTHGWRENLNTGTIFGFYAWVTHRHSEGKKTVYDGVCYLGKWK